jgi:hypothetical protein
MRTLALAALVLFAVGCTSDPIVDMRGVDQAAYNNDLAACREYADQVDIASGAAGGTAIGAAGGAALGAVLGWITGDPGTGAALGAVSGGATGGVSGGGSRASKKDRIVRNCLRERGYPVLD